MLKKEKITAQRSKGKGGSPDRAHTIPVSLESSNSSKHVINPIYYILRAGYYARLEDTISLAAGKEQVNPET